jgi:hypothetical protein
MCYLLASWERSPSALRRQYAKYVFLCYPEVFIVLKLLLPPQLAPKPSHVTFLSTRKSSFTPLGSMSLDSDIRYLMNFTKDRIDSPELKSNVTLCKACPPLARLNQITVLLNVDDLEDALDLIGVSKKKGNWELKLDDVKSLLSLRVDFDGSKVNDLLQLDD